jgi:hypothetical protein
MDINNCLKEEYFNFGGGSDMSNNNINSSAGKSQLSIKSTPLDKNFRIHKQSDKFKFSNKDIIYFKNRQLRLTNSAVFYLNHFYKKEPYFEFNNSIGTPTTVKLCLNI